MDRVQQRILEIATQIPEYVGYQAKERRRESDKLVRRQLAGKYEEERSLLARLARQAPLDQIVDLENLDQKLQRLIARLNTAPGGYAGWFDAGQIGDSDLDLLIQFDSSLTEGVAAFKAALDNVASALKSKQNVGDSIGACADLVDSLNAQFDQREQFLSMGKRPSPLNVPPAVVSSPLDALHTKAPPPQELVALGTLNINDAVSYAGSDFIVSGKITYSVPTGTFWAFLLSDRTKPRWLRVGPAGQISVCVETEQDVPDPAPETLNLSGVTFTRETTGTANVSVEGPGGSKRGSVKYNRYTGPTLKILWIEDFGPDKRTMQGEIVDASEIKIYRR